MTSRDTPPGAEPNVSARPPAITGRFVVERKIGKGGMAQVYAVQELKTGRQLALKRLQALGDPNKQRRSVELFEREFYTLAHLKHPRVVEVYDYGVAEDGPFYTMELLDGGGLEQLSPLPWRQAASVARDIASVLSLVHARLLVYRDLNPRNVRCTAEGTAKLIDFGALCAMGQSHQLVGTPAYCAPEMLDMQPLDARTDLYALGATLYFMLTGRHAYPARSFDQLRQYWVAEPRTPRQLVPQVPPALDALVMHLLHPDPSVRPASAAEVAEQLLVIEGRTCDDLALYGAAYLTTPTLVGREPVLTRVRRRVARARDRRGGAMLFEGPPGVGRSRLLAACLLEAKLLGALALRADAQDARSDWGVLRALCSQLLLLAGDLTRRAAGSERELLARALPELAETPAADSGSQPPPDGSLRAGLLSAVRTWLCAIAAERPLIIAIDDLHAIDEPSSAALALLIHSLKDQRVLVIGSVPSSSLQDPPAALRLFADGAITHRLDALSKAETLELLRSVFGDVQHLQLVAQELYAISQGNPQALLGLAQSLVEQELAKHRAGVWTLPESIGRGVLPSTMAQALRKRVEQLTPLAREVAQYLVLAVDRSLSFDECLGLCAHSPALQVNEALNELMRQQLVASSGVHYELKQRGAAEPLESLLEKSPETARNMHRKLAELFRRRGDEELRRTRHMFAAGDDADALDVLLAESERSMTLTDNDSDAYGQLATSLPPDWFELFRRGLALCDGHARPRQARYSLANRLAGLVDVMNVPGEISYPTLRGLLDQLAQDSGLADYEALDPTQPPLDRLKQAIGMAQARYTAAPEHARGYDPLTAIQRTVRTTSAVAGYAAKNLDWQLLQQVPSLAPFVPLSHAVNVVYGLVRGVTARTTSRFDAARGAYLQLIAQTETPGSTGIGETHERLLRVGVMFGLGVIEASMGLESCLRWAREVEVEPLHRVSAQLIRFLNALWQGQPHEADRLQREIELMRLRDSPRQLLEGIHLIGEATVNALSDDLTRMKRSCQSIDALARRQKPWEVVAIYARAEHRRICGDLNAALRDLESLLASQRAGQHQIWPSAAAAHVRVLYELGFYQDACMVGQHYLQDANSAGLEHEVNHLKLPLALAYAETKQPAHARRLLDEVLTRLRTLGASGLNLLLAYETAARIALIQRDAKTYEQYMRLALDCAHSHHPAAPTLVARCEKLKRHARANERRRTPTLLGLAELDDDLTTGLDPQERAHKILGLLIDASGARGGVLYLQRPQGLELCAQTPDAELSDRLVEHTTSFLYTHVHQNEEQTQTLDADEAPLIGPEALWHDADGDRYRPLLLSHQNDRGFVITGVVVLIERCDETLKNPGKLIARASALAAMSGDAELTHVN
ncbi:MAG: serine/threonine-protein kinase [Polyangiales bacterium]